MPKSKAKRNNDSVFWQDYKKAKQAGRDTDHLRQVMKRVAKGETLEHKYDDHGLTGKYKRHRSCKIQPDFLLIYQKSGNSVSFVRCGTHQEMFDERFN